MRARIDAGGWVVACAIGLGAVVALLVPALGARGALETRRHRIDRLTAASLSRVSLPGDARCAPEPGMAIPVAQGTFTPVSSGWQTIGGCGAGSSGGVGGIKWIGRNVSGGLVNVQCQGNYTRYDNGYVYGLTNQLTLPLSDAWSVGVVVPYLYKWVDDPVQLGFDLSNRGPGDINALVTWKLGPIRATAVTFAMGIPTGSHDADYQGFILPQDRQLGAGSLSGSLMIDHSIDRLSGPTVLGILGSYPGGENEIGNYRSPSATAYGYVGYLLGAFVPAVGLSGTLFRDADRDVGLASDARANAMLAANGSLEWSTEWLAVLAGISLPYSARGLEPWTAGLGFAVAPF